MILLDTNVVSELMRKAPAPRVLEWLGEQNRQQLYLTVITVIEIRRGLALLPQGRRQDELGKAFDRFLELGFNEKILSFTQTTARVYAPIYQSRVASGLGIGELDLIVAAIAKEHGACVATRNTADFLKTGIELVNPWE